MQELELRRLEIDEAIEELNRVLEEERVKVVKRVGEKKEGEVEG